MTPQQPHVVTSALGAAALFPGALDTSGEQRYSYYGYQPQYYVGAPQAVFPAVCDAMSADAAGYQAYNELGQLTDQFQVIPCSAWLVFCEFLTSKSSWNGGEWKNEFTFQGVALDGDGGAENTTAPTTLPQAPIAAPNPYAVPYQPCYVASPYAIQQPLMV